MKSDNELNEKVLIFLHERKQRYLEDLRYNDEDKEEYIRLSYIVIGYDKLYNSIRGSKHSFLTEKELFWILAMPERIFPEDMPDVFNQFFTRYREKALVQDETIDLKQLFINGFSASRASKILKMEVSEVSSFFRYFEGEMLNTKSAIRIYKSGIERDFHTRPKNSVLFIEALDRIVGYDLAIKRLLDGYITVKATEELISLPKENKPLYTKTVDYRKDYRKAVIEYYKKNPIF